MTTPEEPFMEGGGFLGEGSFADQAAAERKGTVIRQAAAIKDARAALKIPLWPEPKPKKFHWDHLLEEMAWLAKEFHRERSWKLRQARRFAQGVARSNKDLESRLILRAREEEKTRRKRAAWIAKEVMAFWDKAGRIVAHRRKAEADAKRKEMMDRQLDALLGQTQRYSNMLAARLAGEAGPSDGDVKAPQSVSQLAKLPSLQDREKGNGSAAVPVERRNLASTQEEQAATEMPQDGREEEEQLADEIMDEIAAEGEEEGDDYVGDSDDADDEATLEEEEEAARVEGHSKEAEAEELQGLEADADVPLEQLLASMGVPGAEMGQEKPERNEDRGRPSLENGAEPSMDALEQDDDEDKDASQEYAGDSDDADDEAMLEEEEEAAQVEGYSKEAEAEELQGLEADADVPLEQLLASMGVPVPDAVGSERILDKPLPVGELNLRGGNGPELTSPRGPSHLAMEGDLEGDDAEDEYMADSDDMDDEATLEEEERAALAEGEAAGHQQAEELAGLAAEADMDLDQLLAQYGYMNGQKDEHREETKSVMDMQPVSRSDKLERKTEEDEHRADADQEEEVPATMTSALEAMQSAQPTGFTLATHHVTTKPPFLLKGQLREYQQIGLDWLVTLYHKRLNGILADEMGLGKTIQTIALLAYLACEQGDWGPHLVVVPTSVMLNWEMEFKKWCPAFKLLTYFGSVKDRAFKRQGWSKPNAFHVCITSYTLVLQDARMFKRKKWKYLILDEAHMIKNWKSQRWQTLLNFNSKRRLLITGTPLQNDLMELWSLMHFLMPQVFASHAQFKNWFSDPLVGMVEGSSEMNRAIVERLHAVLRPFLLRRLKRDVEKQLPAKHEHVVYCPLSKRQRLLYEEYMASSTARTALSSGNYLGLMNCLMQLRKVCNHPDLFEPRPIVSAFDMLPALNLQVPCLVARTRVEESAERKSGFRSLLLDADEIPGGLGDAIIMPGTPAWAGALARERAEPQTSFQAGLITPDVAHVPVSLLPKDSLSAGALESWLGFQPGPRALLSVAESLRKLIQKATEWRADRVSYLGRLSRQRCQGSMPVLGAELEDLLRVRQPEHVHILDRDPRNHLEVSDVLKSMILLPEARVALLRDVLVRYLCYIPKARAPAPLLVSACPRPAALQARLSADLSQVWYAHGGVLHLPRTRTSLFFPDKRLVQFDAGKLQELAMLLARLKLGGHRALIFTQMSRMLDILETFLSLHGYTYVRLDGATKPEQRQWLMQRFNADPKIFCFILSTRSGGVGMNLTGADTVIFYDSDWNPAMDAQAQDRCHRIGQTKEVHIYRMVSQHTIEENILKKSDQKRHLDFLAIQSGGFTADGLGSTGGLAPVDILADAGAIFGRDVVGEAELPTTTNYSTETAAHRNEELAAAMRAAEDEGDAEAAAALERETAAQMDEFTREPPVAEAPEEKNGKADSVSRDLETPTQEDDTAEPSSSSYNNDNDIVAPSSASPPPAAIDLSLALRPIERYAVSLIEEAVPEFDPETVADAVAREFTVEEFDVNAMDNAELEREEAIDEDEEQNIVMDWDERAATEAYKAQLEAAKLEEEARANAEAAWLAEQERLFAAAAAAAPSSISHRTSKNKPRSVQDRAESDTALSPRGGIHLSASRLVSRKKEPPLRRPWEPLEDLVLCLVLQQESAGLDTVPTESAACWRLVASALAAGSAASSVAGAEAAARLGRTRRPADCAARFAVLCEAAHGGNRSIRDVRRRLASLPTPLVASIIRALFPLQPAGRKALGTVAKELLEVVNQQQDKQEEAATAAFSSKEETGVLAAVTQAVRERCGPGAVRVITARLPQVLETSRLRGSKSLVEPRMSRLGGGDKPGGAMKRPRSEGTTISNENGPWVATAKIASSPVNAAVGSGEAAVLRASSSEPAGGLLSLIASRQSNSSAEPRSDTKHQPSVMTTTLPGSQPDPMQWQGFVPLSFHGPGSEPSTPAVFQPRPATTLDIKREAQAGGSFPNAGPLLRPQQVGPPQQGYGARPSENLMPPTMNPQLLLALHLLAQQQQTIRPGGIVSPNNGGGAPGPRPSFGGSPQPMSPPSQQAGATMGQQTNLTVQQLGMLAAQMQAQRPMMVGTGVAPMQQQPRPAMGGPQHNVGPPPPLGLPPGMTPQQQQLLLLLSAMGQGGFRPPGPPFMPPSAPGSGQPLPLIPGQVSGQQPFSGPGNAPPPP